MCRPWNTVKSFAAAMVTLTCLMTALAALSFSPTSGDQGDEAASWREVGRMFSGLGLLLIVGISIDFCLNYEKSWEDAGDFDADGHAAVQPGSPPPAVQMPANPPPHTPIHSDGGDVASEPNAATVSASASAGDAPSGDAGALATSAGDAPSDDAGAPATSASSAGDLQDVEGKKKPVLDGDGDA